MTPSVYQICIDKPQDTEQDESMTQDPLKSSDTSNTGNASVSESAQRNEVSSSKSFVGKSLSHWGLLLLSSLGVIVGSASASLLGRLYFVHGGSHRWLYACTQTVAWPIIVPPLLLCYWQQSVGPTRLSTKLLVIYVVMGVVSAFDNLLYSWGLSYLPVSTNSLLTCSQLAFTAVFAFALLRKKITPFSLNSVFIITIGAVLLAVHGDSDRPRGTSKKQYNLGFVAIIAASAIYALLLTLTEVIYKNVVGKTNFIVVLEVQAGISAAATMFSMLGMWIVGDFSAIRHEARHFELGSSRYILILFWSAIGWQFFFVGSAAIIFLTSSLMACVFTTATIPLIPLLAVVFFHDNFSALKAISMLMSVWGFMSYIYGGYLNSKRTETAQC